MKLTKEQLRKIIKEELGKILSEEERSEGNFNAMKEKANRLIKKFRKDGDNHKANAGEDALADSSKESATPLINWLGKVDPED